MLYLVATPIGNLGDITYRAVEILKTCDYILCEDTRHSRPLLHHYAIHKPLKSLHKFNEASREKEVIESLKQGLKIALISDAGTPGIADPGAKIVQSCRLHSLPVAVIPGACAAIAALTASGLDTEIFQFIGFLPRKAGELKACLQNALLYPGTTICYETPHRLEDTLKQLDQLAPARPLILARELTKKFEEFLSGKAADLLLHLPLKGEMVLLISKAEQTEMDDWSLLKPHEHVQQLVEDYGLTLQDAIKTVAKLRGVPKRAIYNEVMR